MYDKLKQGMLAMARVALRLDTDSPRRGLADPYSLETPWEKGFSPRTWRILAIVFWIVIIGGVINEAWLWAAYLHGNH